MALACARGTGAPLKAPMPPHVPPKHLEARVMPLMG